ncbi:MAG: sigma 54-interacting transcriptional regulator [Planctomycetota bacterium]
MAQLEITTGERQRSIVALGRESLPLGLDADGRVAWGKGRVARPVAEVVPAGAGHVLRSGAGERRLVDGEPVGLPGFALTYRGDPAASADVGAAAIAEIGRLLLSQGSAAALYDRVLDSVARVLDVAHAAIALFDEDEVLRTIASRGSAPEVNPALARAVVDTGAAILTSEAEVRGEGGDALRIEVRSILCAPLRHEGRALGILFADNEGRSSSFSNEELDFASAVAHLASFALGHLDRTEKLREENTRLKRRLELGDPVVFASGAMAEVQRKVEKVAGFDATVLLTGESGVGKEWIAREIHRRSPRADGPFVAVNCAAIPDTLLESELFGYAPHSGISGADPKGRAGRFEQAHRGSIFLDEIGELKPELQAKLLRVLQDKKVDRLNDTVSREVDVRILVSTNQNLEKLAAAGRFREDLYYRLNVIALPVPPLRARREDVLPLAEYFVLSYPGPETLRRARISPAAARALARYDWPGNVREMKNCIEQALILGDGKTIRLADLPPRVREAASSARDEALPPLREVERDHIARVLRATSWNKARSARLLGISKPTLYEKIRAYGLAPDA